MKDISSKPTRYISTEVKRQVWQRDGGECGFVNPRTQQKCCAKHHLEYDHVYPLALGGKSTVENLRLRCRAHNQLAAVQSLGERKMAEFIPRLR